MLVLTIVAVRLIGVWVLVAHTPTFVAGVLSAYALLQSGQMDAMGNAPLIAVAVAGALPLLAGLLLLIFSISIANLVVPAGAKDLPVAGSISAKTVTQIGVFLIGVWLVGIGLPVVVALGMTISPDTGIPFSSQHWLSVGLGIMLMVGSGALAGLVGKLRSWP